MPILSEQPILIPSTPEEVYPHQWIYNFIVHSPTVDTGTVKIQLLPYNAETKQLGSGVYMETIDTNDLWLAVSEVPEVGRAMATIFNALGPLKEWIKTKNTQVQPEVVEEVQPEVVEEANI
jgi:hypothetical protein